MANLPFNIMCFSWNAAGLRLCETMSQSKANNARQGAIGVFKSSCVAPNFFEDIRDAIRQKLPALVVMVTEDEASTGSYFHSNLLPEAMPEIGYTRLRNEKFDKPTEGNGSIRISIYTRVELVDQFKLQGLVARLFGDNSVTTATCQQYGRVSGAIAIYVQHEVYGRLAFIATHLPLGSILTDLSATMDYDTKRAAIRATNTLCLIHIMDKLVNALPATEHPDYVFLLGDLNYDITVPGRHTIEIATNLTPQGLRNMRQYDELRRALEEPPLLGFKEGMAGEGPLFAPTTRLVRGRGTNCVLERGAIRIDASCFDNTPVEQIGWHDRILYKNLLTAPYLVHCVEYNRVDVKNMHESTHAGVAGFYELRPTR